MIPKIIHYIWIGNKRLDRLSKKCIKSWQKYCPNYKFMFWSEQNLPIEKFNFSKDAYKHKKFAFVVDVMRLYVLKRYGGVYLDTDTEIIRPIDELLNNDSFFGFEETKYISCGIIGSSISNKHISNLLDIYTNKVFNINSLDSDTIPINVTNYFIVHGLNQNGSLQAIDGCRFYPKDFFYPRDIETGVVLKTKNTFAIHHWAGSWAENKLIKERKKRQFFSKHKKLNKIILPLRFLKRKLIKYFDE